MQPALRAIFTRPCPAILSRGLSLTSTRSARGDTIPTDAEQATGLEKIEYDAMAAGIQDPFNMKPYEGPPGTKDKPLEVFSMFDERIIGCVYNLTVRESKPESRPNDDLDNLFITRDKEPKFQDLDDFLTAEHNNPELDQTEDFDDFLSTRENKPVLHQKNDHSNFFNDWIERYM